MADVFRRFGPAFRDQHGASLSSAQRHAMTAIESCRTAALGGHVEQCGDCGHQRVSYNSCRNRNCPKCQGLARAQWLEDRQAELLDVPYFHVVFTVPAQIEVIAFQNQTVVYDILFRAASETLRTIAADPEHLGRGDWLPGGAAQLGTDPDAEPSDMIPGIIISSIFSEQGKLVLRAAPLQNQFAGAVEAIDNSANGFGVQIAAANFPGCTGSQLFTL